MSNAPRHLFTVGHSRHDPEHFFRLLHEHGIETLVDVRSRPLSRFAPWANRAALERATAEHGIEYSFLGDAIGGRPAEAEYYDGEGHVLYGRVADSARFRRGIAALERLIEPGHTAVLCSEEDPAACHRRLLIGRVLTEHGIVLRHIRGTGEVQDEREVTLSPPRRRRGTRPALIPAGTPDPWRSVKPVATRAASTSSQTDRLLNRQGAKNAKNAKHTER